MGPLCGCGGEALPAPEPRLVVVLLGFLSCEDALAGEAGVVWVADVVFNDA